MPRRKRISGILKIMVRNGSPRINRMK